MCRDGHYRWSNTAVRRRHFFCQIGMERSMHFRVKWVWFCDSGSDVQKIFAIRTETILNFVLKLFTLCGLTGQKTHRGGLGLGRSGHEEAHHCFTYFTQTPLKSIDIGSINCSLIQLIPSSDYSIREKYSSLVHRCSQGCSGCTCTARAVKIFFSRNLQGKCVSAPQDTKCTPPRPQQESIFRTFFAGRVRFGGIFRPSFEGDD